MYQNMPFNPQNNNFANFNPNGQSMSGVSNNAPVPAPSDNKSLSLKDAEIENIKKALIKHEGNRSKAAEELGISRRTLLNKIEDYGLNKVDDAN